jgi:hypothetical protein
LLSAAVLFLSASQSTATTYNSGVYYYALVGSSARITNYTGSDAHVAIPDTLDGHTVTVIGDGAFDYGTMASVTIPDSVTTIEKNAFCACADMTSVSIGDGVTFIGDFAFGGCASLTGIAIPAGVTTIEDDAFSACASLTAITVDPGNASYASRDGALYNTGLTALHAVPGSVRAFVIPEGVTSIRDYALSACWSLTSVRIPEGVTTIGASAFEVCRSLPGVTIPKSVTVIKDYAFDDCTVLTSVIFEGNAPEEMGSYVFYHTASDLCLYYRAGASGFTTPTWNGYATQVLAEGAAWADSYELPDSDGWYVSFWYGTYYAGEAWGNWNYNSAQGWQYVPGEGTTDSVYLYDASTASWWWTSASFWPYFYEFGDDAWYCYVEGVAPLRICWSYKANALVTK